MPASAVADRVQVNGFAKKFAGKVFNNKEEEQFGEAKLQGDA